MWTTVQKASFPGGIRWGQGRRKFFVLTDIAKVVSARSKNRAAGFSPLACEAVRLIGVIFNLERELIELTAGKRLKLRQQFVRPPIEELDV